MRIVVIILYEEQNKFLPTVRCFQTRLVIVSTLTTANVTNARYRSRSRSSHRTHPRQGRQDRPDESATSDLTTVQVDLDSERRASKKY